MSEHSPGPWTCAYVGSGDWHVDAANGHQVATVWGAGSDKTTRAHARLVAAAPELLEALEAALRLVERDLDDEKVAPLYALIARIRG